LKTAPGAATIYPFQLLLLLLRGHPPANGKIPEKTVGTAGSTAAIATKATSEIMLQ